MTQSREGLHHDAIFLAVVEQVPFREIWMRLDLNQGWLDACAFKHLSYLCQIDVREADSLAPTFVDQALHCLPRTGQRRRLVVNHVAFLVSRVLLIAGSESEWSMDAIHIDIVELQSFQTCL